MGSQGAPFPINWLWPQTMSSNPWKLLKKSWVKQEFSLPPKKWPYIFSYNFYRMKANCWWINMFLNRCMYTYHQMFQWNTIVHRTIMKEIYLGRWAVVISKRFDGGELAPWTLQWIFFNDTFFLIKTFFNLNGDSWCRNPNYRWTVFYFSYLQGS